MKIKIKKLKGNAVLPKMMRQGDAALDLYAVEDVKIKVDQRVVVATGIAMEIPKGYVGNVRDRGGLARNHGLHTLGGVVDSNYRGDILVVMINLSKEDYQIKEGDRIAQMMIHKIEIVDFEEVSELSESARGKDGFTSSGY